MIPPKARILVVNEVGATTTTVADMVNFDIVIAPDGKGAYHTIKNSWSRDTTVLASADVETLFDSIGVRSAT
jgi:hypothetical protein